MSIVKNNLSVKDVMVETGGFPVVDRGVIFKVALEKMGESGLGIVCIDDNDGHLLGILTDGDIRRKLLTVQKPFSAFFVDDALDHAIKSPTVVSPDMNLVDAVKIMESKEVWDLPVIDKDGKLVGLLHLHAAIKVLLDLND